MKAIIKAVVDKISLRSKGCYVVQLALAEVLISLLLPMQQLGAKESSYVFTSYNTDYGFVQKEVMKIAQDHDGRMWFATWDGLYCFDGYRFANFKARPGNGVRLESNRIESICVDGDNIWMRGYAGSVARFCVSKQAIEEVSLNGSSAQNILLAAGGNGIWIRTTDGHVLKAIVDKKINKVAVSEVYFRKGEKITQMHLDKRGNLLVATSDGAWRIRPDGKSQQQMVHHIVCHDITVDGDILLFACSNGRMALRLNGKTAIVKLPTPSPLKQIMLLRGGRKLVSTESDGLFLLRRDNSVEQHIAPGTSVLASGRSITKMLKDSWGDVWFCTGSPGVVRYNAAGNSFCRLFIEGEFGSDASMWLNDVNLLEDKLGHLWVSPSGNGLALYDRAANKLVPFLDGDRQKVWTAENTLVDMFIDKQSNVWYCGKYTGLQKATLREKGFFTPSMNAVTENGRDVRGLFQDSKGRIWIGAKNGVISVFDHQMRPIGNLTSDGKIIRGSTQPVGHAYCFAEDKNGVIWIGTKFNGLFRLQPIPNGAFRMSHYVADGKPYSLCNNDIFSLCTDHSGRLWIATYGGGLCYLRLDDSKYRFIHSGNLLTSYPIRRFGRARHITSDGKGSLWVGTSSGLLRFKEKFSDPRQIKFHAYTRNPNDATSLSNNDVLQVFFTHSGAMYVCTYGGGFCRVTQHGGDSLTFRPFTTADGLRSDILFSMQEDKAGNLWIATEGGFIKYYPKADRTENFSWRAFGKHLDINEGISLRLANGQLMFPSRNYAAVYFDPMHVKVSAYTPTIIFTRLVVEQTEQSPSVDKSAIIHTDINSCDRITLPPGKNSFSIDFSALDFRDPQNISYAYKLEGLDAEWNMVGSSHTAIYSNLPPGEYTLLVRSTNSDGTWANNVRTLPITMQPSFWQTGWAWLLYMLFVLGVIAATTYFLFIILRLKQKVHIEQEISDMKLQFFTNISHEIRTPLTLIAGSVKEILRRGVAEQWANNALKVVDENSNRLLRLVNQILDFRKVESGNMRLTLRKTDVGKFVGQVMDNFTHLATIRNINFKLARPEQSVVAWVDREKLDKIVFNLLSNAFRFTTEGKAIAVGVEDTDSGVKLTVVDEGKGISPERQKTIFHLFSSDNSGSALYQPHTGIGLALTKELVELHRGTITVKSELGKGSTFTVLLPYNPPMQIPNADYVANDGEEDEHINRLTLEEEGATPQPEDRETVNSGDSRKLTLLVVEDNSQMRDFIRLVMRDAYHVVDASDGCEGLTKAVAEQPDVIITDYMMPVMDGMEMARRLRSNLQTSHIPLVMLSARTDEKSQIKGLKTGVDAYVCKPFSAEVLKARLANLVERRRQLQQVNVRQYVEKVANPTGIIDHSGVRAAMSDADKAFLERLTKLLETNISSSDMGVDDVACMMGMSRSVYFKKLKSLTGLGPNDFLKSMRMKRAAKLLETKQYAIGEIAIMIGFDDPHYFSKCFKQYYGKTPTEWCKS